MPSESDPLPCVRFGRFELELDSGVLSREGRPVRLAPQPSRVLAYLAARPGRLVLRDELRRHVWGDRFIDADGGLNSCIRDVRAALGDDAARPVYVETVPRRGYRFIAPVERVADATPAAPVWPRKAGWIGLGVAVTLTAVALWTLGPPEAPEPALPASKTRLPSDRTPPDEARDAYLEARYLLARPDADSAARAVERFRFATAAAPDWANAHAGLGAALRRSAAPPRDKMPAARAAFERAAQLDPGLAAAHLGLARVEQDFGWDLSAARDRLGRARALGLRSAELLETEAFLELLDGRPDRALEKLDLALEVDPVAARIQGDIGWILSMTGRHAEAAAQCRRALTVEPEAAWLHACVADALRILGRYDEALIHARREMALRGASPDWMGRVEGRPGPALVAWDRWRLEWLLEIRSRTYVPSCMIGIQLARLGDGKQALDYLESAYEERSSFMPFLEREPALKPLRNEPRFRRLTARIRAELQARAAATEPAPGVATSGS